MDDQSYPDDRDGGSRHPRWRSGDEPLELMDGLPPPGSYTTNLPVVQRRRFLTWRNAWRAAAVAVLLFIAAIAWLAITAPLSKSLQPPVPPSITLLASDGTPVARTGAIIDAPVDAEKLPLHVKDAFLAIEDRRFYSHWGVDPRGLMRAFMANLTNGSVTQGGSTITQQLAKNAFLNSDRTAGRKIREVMIAFWLEYWLSKNEILSRYLSNVYFGDNVYGLRAASLHYFSREPDALTIGQAAMLAGLVKAPSRLAPTNDLKAARARQKLVVQAMVEAHFLNADEAEDVKPASLKVASGKLLPAGTYFADWVMPAARDRDGGIQSGGTVRTTLEADAQRAAERAVKNARLNKAEVAIVSMRTDGRVIAMVGGRDYAKSQFNRATAGNRQAGSTFKLFVYLAAMRDGMTPDDMIDDKPVTIGKWKPQNSGNVYRGPITLERAFAASSNVASARITSKVGPRAVIKAARDLGISTPIPSEATIALGTPSVSLLELTAAYAAIANGSAPVHPHGLADQDNQGWLDKLSSGTRPIGSRNLDEMRRLLKAVVDRGTGRGARLPVQAYGKTGTTQDNRDAWFIGYSGDIVTGVWLGNDDNTPNAGLSGSGLPVRIWRDYMRQVVPGADAPPPPVPTADPEDSIDGGNGAAADDPMFEADLGDGSSLRIDDRGISIDRQSPDDGDDGGSRDRRDDRRLDLPRRILDRLAPDGRNPLRDRRSRPRDDVDRGQQPDDPGDSDPGYDN